MRGHKDENSELFWDAGKRHWVSTKSPFGTLLDFECCTVRTRSLLIFPSCSGAVWMSCMCSWSQSCLCCTCLCTPTLCISWTSLTDLRLFGSENTITRWERDYRVSSVLNIREHNRLHTGMLSGNITQEQCAFLACIIHLALEFPNMTQGHGSREWLSFFFNFYFFEILMCLI